MKKVLRYFVYAAFLLFTACTIVFNPSEASSSIVEYTPAPDPDWETPLNASDLPVLQLHQGGAHTLDWKFANMLKAGELWIISSSGGNLTESNARRYAASLSVDDHGWPRSLPRGLQFQASPGYPTGIDDEGAYEYLTGVYVLTWDGDGEVSFGGIQYQGGAQIMYRGPGRQVLKIVSSADRPVVRVTASAAGNHVRNMKLWAPAYDGAGLELEFTDDMSPGNISGSLEPAPGETDPFWHPEFLRHMRENSEYGVIRFMGWLDINGIDDGGTLTWEDRSIGDYAGYNLSVIDEDYTRHSVRSFKQQIGCPYEWIVDLCNILGKDLWIQVPHTADAGFPGELAKYLLGEGGYPGLRKDLRVWVELSNEIWNTAEAYLPQATAALEAAASELGVSAGSLEFMSGDHAMGSGLLQRRFLKRFENAWRYFGGSDERLINVAAGFTMNSAFNSTMIDTIKEEDPQLPEVLAITTYFGGGYSVTEQLYSILPGEEEVPDNEIVDWIPEEADFQSAKDIVSREVWQNYGAFEANASVAEDNGMHLVCYEGGQHILAFGFADWDNPRHSAFMYFLEDFERSEYMEELYLDHWALWTAAGGRTASLFVDVGRYAVWGYWGARETIFDDSWKWSAFLEWGDTMAGIRDPQDPVNEAPVLSALEYRCEAGESWSASVTASGGDGPLAISVIGGDLPPGVTFSDSGGGSGLFSGTPSEHGNYRSIVRVLDGDNDPDYGICTIQVDPAGTGENGIFFFRGEDLPYSENEGHSLRWDPLRSRVTGIDPYEFRALPALFDEPLFGDMFTAPGLSEFSLSSDGPNYPLNPYGGWRIELIEDHEGVEDGPSDWVGFRNRQFEAWVGHNESPVVVPSEYNLCLVWKRDQFTRNATAANYRFSGTPEQATMRIDLTSVSDTYNEIRFIILHNDDTGTGSGEINWYVSEASFNSELLGAEPYFQLTGFNNSDAEGKGWALMETPPMGQDPGMPDSETLTFGPKDFTDVRGIGFFYRGRRFGYHWQFSFDRFFALGEIE